MLLIHPVMSIHRIDTPSQPTPQLTTPSTHPPQLTLPSSPSHLPPPPRYVPQHGIAIPESDVDVDIDAETPLTTLTTAESMDNSPAIAEPGTTRAR